MKEKSHQYSIIAEQLGYKNINVVFSSRLKRSWKLKSYLTGRKEITLPAVLSDAPFEVKKAILHWSHLRRPHFKKNRSQYYIEKRELEAVVWSYLKECGGVHSRSVASSKKLSNLITKGLKYDLQDIFNKVNIEYFDNELVSFLRWGKKGTRTSYQNWYNTEENENVSMITIAALYNHPDIPEFAIKSVMFHEMLHIAVPPYIKNGRRVVHGREFREAQKRNPDLEKWFHWEKTDLQRILRSRKY